MAGRIQDIEKTCILTAERFGGVAWRSKVAEPPYIWLSVLRPLCPYSGHRRWLKCRADHEWQQFAERLQQFDCRRKVRLGPPLSFPVLLDWTSCGPQACVSAMEKDKAYDFGEAFARLTCFLEDAAGLAVKGQSPRLGSARRVRLTAALDAAVHAAGAVLNEIRAEMDH